MTAAAVDADQPVGLDRVGHQLPGGPNIVGLFEFHFFQVGFDRLEVTKIPQLFHVHPFPVLPLKQNNA